MITRLFDVREGLTRIDAELIHVLLGEVPLNQLHELCDDDGAVGWPIDILPRLKHGGFRPIQTAEAE